MFGFDKIKLSFSYSPVFFILAVLVVLGYAIYVYRYTIPQVKPSKKVFLILLRTLALILLIFIFFEPILALTKKVILEPVNMVFVDNSKSIEIKDGTHREENIKNFITGYGKSGLINNSEFFTFGTKIKKLPFDSLKQINFSEGSTNFSNIFSNIQKTDQNISSIVIISDGVITEGMNPVYNAEKMGIPVYTIGVGDTSQRNDIEVKNILHNEYIYVNNPTTIAATIINKGFANKNIVVTLYEDNKAIDQKNITLSSDGIQNINFIYAPKTSGDKKLTVEAGKVKGEFTYANNKKSFFINVRSNKLKIAVIAGSVSADLSFIKNSLMLDTNIVVNPITVIAQNRFIENNNRQKILDSADVLFLIGFPSKETPDNFYKEVEREIQTKNKPFFITLSSGIDFTKLKDLQSDLPFTIGKQAAGINEVQPVISPDESDNSLLQNNAPDPIQAWNNLPPVYQPATDFGSKPESEVLSTVKISNVPIRKPLIVTRRFGNQRAIAVLAKDIWKWKLQTAPQHLDLFDSFIHSSVKWLNISNEQKQFTLKTTRKFYALDEPIEFNAQVYDEALNPVSDADVSVKIKNKNEEYEVHLGSIGNGLYEGTFNASKAGDYKYEGTAERNKSQIGKAIGEFNIGDVDIEMVNPRMNYDFLNVLAKYTGGKYYTAPDYKLLFNRLNERLKTASSVKLKTSEVNLWSDEWLMIAAIILFALEWFFRKRSGML